MVNDIGLMFAEESTAWIGAVIEGGARFNRRSAKVDVSQYFRLY